jgi:hypothetical protein
MWGAEKRGYVQIAGMAAGVKVGVLMQFQHLRYQNEWITVLHSKFSLKGTFHFRSLSNIFFFDSPSESLKSMSITSPWMEYSYMTAENYLVPLKCAFGLTEIISPIVFIFTANGVVRNFLVQLQRWYVSSCVPPGA